MQLVPPNVADDCLLDGVAIISFAALVLLGHVHPGLVASEDDVEQEGDGGEAVNADGESLPVGGFVVEERPEDQGKRVKKRLAYLSLSQSYTQL